MKFKNLVITAAAISLTGAAGLASAETWRFGLEENEGSVQYQYAKEFKKRIEKKSDGDITVQLLPYGKWGSSYSDLYDAAQSGAIQLSFGSGELGGTVPESQLLTLNFVMPADQKETTKILNSDEFLHSDAWQDAFRDKGLVPLSNLAEGYQVWTSNKEIRKPEDMKNLHIRVMDNSLLRDTYRAYGASPVSIAYGELYSALQQGQAEANIQPVFAHENMSFYEVQDYMIFADQSHFVATLMGSEEWWQELPDKQRDMVEDVVSKMVDKGYDIQKDFAKERLQKIKDNSDIEIIHLDDEERDQFRKLAKPIRKEYVKEVGDRGKKALEILLEQADKSSDADDES